MMNVDCFPDVSTSDFLDDDFKLEVGDLLADDEQKPSPSTSSKQRAGRDRRKQVCTAPTTCLICGKATGHRHYNVPSCHACKAFFRRSLLQAKNYRCASGTKDCQVWKGVRCKSCRLDRCIVTGMDPSAIVTEAVKELDKATQFYVSYRSRLVGGHDKKCVAAIASNSSENFLKLLFGLEQDARERRVSGYYDPIFFYDCTILDLLRTDKLVAFPSRTVKIEPENAEFFLKEKELGEPPESVVPEHIRRRLWLIIDLFLAIQMAKKLPFFQVLDYKDQEAVLRNVALTNMMLSEAYDSMMRNSATIVMPDGSTPIALHPAIVTNLEFDVFCRVMDPLMRLRPNETEYLLIKAMVYANAAAPGISSSGRAVLEEAQQEFGSLLLRIMQTNDGAAVGAKRFAEATALIEAYAYFTQKHREHIVLMGIILGRRHAKLLECAINVPES